MMMGHIDDIKKTGCIFIGLFMVNCCLNSNLTLYQISVFSSIKFYKSCWVSQVTPLTTHVLSVISKTMISASCSIFGKERDKTKKYISFYNTLRFNSDWWIRTKKWYNKICDIKSFASWTFELFANILNKQKNKCATSTVCFLLL